MISIIRYTPADKSAWDSFVAVSTNATFLHYRDYMDYHSDRFHDFSLLAYDGGRLVALLPANSRDGVLYSHQGLTFGGWLIAVKHFNANTMLSIFDSMRSFLADNGIKRVVYKAIPHIYHKYPAEEDLYALFRNGARIVVTNMSSTVQLGGNIPFNRRSRRVVEKASACGVKVVPSTDYGAFWKMLSTHLKEKYGASPVHTLEEIELLHSRFPDNIKLYMAYQGDIAVAGGVVYDCGDVVHFQYSAVTELGEQICGLGYLYKYLIDTYGDRRYFDFGTSNERNGEYLNSNLIETKSGFGGRGIAYNIYEFDI